MNSVIGASAFKKKNTLTFSWVLFLIIYQMLTPIYVLFSPLIGFMACYLFFLKSDQERAHEDNSSKTYLSFAYFIFIILNKGFYLFSGIIFFSFFYRIFVEWLQTSFKCKNCIILVYVASSYAGIYGLNNLLAYALNESFFRFGWEYGWYIFIDFVIAVLVFRDKII